MGPPPEDDDRLRRLRHVVEDGLVREVRNLVETGDGQNECFRPGRDHEIPGFQPGTVFDFDFVRGDELRAPLEYVDAEAFEAFDGVVGLDLGAPLTHAREHVFESKRRLHVRKTHLLRVADTLDELRRRDECFRRNAPVVQTVAAHFSGFDQSRTPAKPDRAGGRDQARGAGADDDDVVTPVSLDFFAHELPESPISTGAHL